MTTAAAPPESPYVGPRPIPADRALYGREVELRRLLQLLIPERIVLLYSPSGAGKTSLIQAALLPALREQELIVRRPIRVNLDPGLLLAGDRPVNRYVMSTLLSLDEGLPDGQRRTPEELAGLDLPTYLEQTAATDEPRRPEVLIFDQFEEVVTLDPIDREAKEEFFRQVGAALRDPWRWALFAMREDYIAALDPYLPLLPTRLRARFRLDLLAERAAMDAIKKPAADAGYTFTQDAADKLVGDLLEVRLPRPGGGEPVEARGHYVEPVQLQVVCLRIWNQLATGDRTIDLADIERWGNVDTALGDYYDDCVRTIAQGTGTPERQIRDWVEEQLTTPDGLRFQVVEGAGQTEGLKNAVLVGLENAHLIRREHHRGVRWYELTHDRLVRPIQESNAAWRVEHLSLLEREAAVWDQHGRRDHLIIVGAALDEMERLAAEHPDIVGEVEQAFLDECRQRRDDDARRAELDETRRRLHEAERQREVAEREQEAAHLREELAAADAARAQSQAAQAAAEALQAEIETNRVRLKFRLVLALVLVAIVGATAALTLGGFTFYFRGEAITFQGEAEKRERIGTARLLATQVEPLLDRYDLAMLLAVEAHEIDDSPVTRGSLLTAVADKPRLMRFLRGHRGTVTSVAVSPDGRLAATGSLVNGGGQPAGEVFLWDARSGQRIEPSLLGHAHGLAFSPDGRVLASGRMDGAISLWDVTANPPVGIATLSGVHEGEVTSVAFSGDGRLLAAAGRDGMVGVWDVARPAQALATYAVSSRTGGAVRPEAWGVAINSATGLLATGTSDGQVMAWSLATRRQPWAPRPYGGWVRSVIFSPGGDRVLAGGASGIVRIWDTRSGELNGELPTPSRNTILALAVSPDGERLAAAGVDGRTSLWDLKPEPGRRPTAGTTAGAGEELIRGGLSGPLRLPELTGHTDWVWSVAFSPDNRTVFTGSADRTAIAWDLDGRWGRPLGPASATLWSLAIDPSDRFVAAGGDDRVIRVWEIAGGAPVVELQGGHQRAVRALLFSVDGATLVSGGNDNAVVFWDWRGAGTPQTRKTEHLGAVVGLARSQDGRTLVSASCGRSCIETEVLVWDLPSATVVRRLATRDQIGPSSVAISPDGKTVVAGVGFARIALWTLDEAGPDAPPAEPTASLGGSGATGHKGEVRGLAFSADGKTLASSSTDGRVILWDVATRTQLSESLVGTGRTVWDVTFQPDGMLLAVANGDGTVSLRDARSGDRIGPFLRDHGEGARRVAFTSDGATLASTGLDGRVLLWDTDPASWAAQACRIANRNLTTEEWRKYLGERRYQKTCPDLPAGQDD